MSRLTEINFEPAYRQLRTVERAFVDAYVTDLEERAAKTGERLATVLKRVTIAPGDTRALEMLSLALVRAAIVERVRELSNAKELTIDRTLKELQCIAYSSMGNYFDNGADGNPYLTLEKCTPEQLAAIKSLEINESEKGRTFKITLHCKLTGLAHIGKYQHIFKDDNPHWKTITGDEIENEETFETVDDAANHYARMINE